jgi:VanZ family protein
LIADKSNKINKIIMKKFNNVLIKSFHCVNLILIVLYLYPGSLLGYVLYNDSSIELQITRNFLISSNHFYMFIFLSTIGILAYRKSNRINLLIKYLLALSILLELLHLFIPNRSFEFNDLSGNIIGVFIVIIIYKIKNKHV